MLGYARWVGLASLVLGDCFGGTLHRATLKPNEASLVNCLPIVSGAENGRQNAERGLSQTAARWKRSERCELGQLALRWRRLRRAGLHRIQREDRPPDFANRQRPEIARAGPGVSTQSIRAAMGS